MSNYTEFFLDSFSNLIEYDTIQISHSKFTKTYYLVRNALGGLSASIETGELVRFDYLPMIVSPNANKDDLDFSISVTLGDIGNMIQSELDRFDDSDYAEKPELILRTYRSDILTEPMVGPITLNIESVNMVEEGSVITATAEFFNTRKTGLFYTYTRYPSLRYFI